MHIFRIDGLREFISIKLKLFCKRKNITNKYARLYKLKKKNIKKRDRQKIFIIKDFLPVGKSSPINFLVYSMDKKNYIRDRFFTQCHTEKIILNKSSTNRSLSSSRFKISRWHNKPSKPKEKY